MCALRIYTHADTHAREQAHARSAKGICCTAQCNANTRNERNANTLFRTIVRSMHACAPCVCVCAAIQFRSDTLTIMHHILHACAWALLYLGNLRVCALKLLKAEIYNYLVDGADDDDGRRLDNRSDTA